MSENQIKNRAVSVSLKDVFALWGAPAVPCLTYLVVLVSAAIIAVARFGASLTNRGR